MGYEHFRFARRIDANTIGIYHNDLTKLLQVDKVTGSTSTLKGGDFSFRIRANTTADDPSIYMEGGQNLIFTVAATKQLHLNIGGYTAWRMMYASNVTTINGGEATGDDMVLKANVIDSDNITVEGAGDIVLSPTGNVKFGTHTGTGDVVSNGHITIKDAAGNTRKLMTTA